MMAGHLAVGLALKKVDRRINLGVLFFAAMFADFLLGGLVLLNLEQIHIPTNFSEIHYLTFTFPFSHGLVAILIWSAFAYLIVQIIWRANRDSKIRAGLVIALAVLSHFVLDGLVHIPELPLFDDRSPKLGLGLWNQLGLALAIEAALVILGLVIYFKAVKPKNRKAWLGLIILLTLASGMTIAGMALNSTPPPATGAAVSWIGQPFLFGGIGYWLDKKATE